MKKLTTAVVPLLIVSILLSFAGCLKYTGNILEVTKPGTEFPAFTTVQTPAETTLPYVDPAATTLPGVDAATTNPAEPVATTAPAPSGADPSTWTVQQIVDYVNNSVNQTRAYTGNLNVHHTETIEAVLTKAPGGALVQSIANPIIEGAIKPTDETLTFANGQAVDTEGDTVPILLPKKAAFSLNANGVASATARAEGTDTVIEIALVREVGTLDTPPQYNSTAIGYMNAGMVDLSAVTLTACDITYSGSTMKLRINQSGYVVTVDYYVPFVVEAAGKAMFISAEVTCEGSDSESWVLNW
ncbi:MAG: hypothetical protein IJK89_10530 [Clostridia bacterium]|nr:hypothetical protein [Clostridia bacterium]